MIFFLIENNIFYILWTMFPLATGNYLSELARAMTFRSYPLMSG